MPQFTDWRVLEGFNPEQAMAHLAAIVESSEDAIISKTLSQNCSFVIPPPPACPSSHSMASIAHPLLASMSRVAGRGGNIAGIQ